MGDFIQNLPTDSVKPSPEESQIINTLFNNPEKIKNVCVEFKDSIFVGILFLIFTLNYVDKFIKSIFKQAENPYILLGIKTICIMVIYYLAKNWLLCKQ